MNVRKLSTGLIWHVIACMYCNCVNILNLICSTTSSIIFLPSLPLLLVGAINLAMGSQSLEHILTALASGLVTLCTHAQIRLR